MSILEDQYAFRAELLKALRQDLVGPKAAEEAITDAPITTYAVGVLFPQHSGAIAADQDHDIAEGDDEGVFGDPPVAMSNTRYPSSMGVTFAVDLGRATTIQVEPEAARYEPLGSAESAPSWRRVQCDFQPVSLDVGHAYTDEWPLGDGLHLFARVREPDSASTVSVTLALVNRRIGEWPRDPDSFFQPRLVVQAGETASFVERGAAHTPVGDAEQAAYRLLYRHARNFAVGHGCAADWDETGDASHVAEIRTEYVPAYAVRLADSNPEITASALDMRTLAEGPRSLSLAGLEELCSGYERWIDAREDEAETLPPELWETARAHLDECRRAVARMRAGVSILAVDDRAWEAFILANRAMVLQRVRSVWHEAERPSGGPDEDVGAKWRPFQLAFILLCLPGVIDPEHEDRQIADLLWFPTGGGKTEAYLGLIAFTLFHRRLRDGDRGDGVAALMRYTLRLLTTQQFERAALLICCCEVVRAEDQRLGSEPFLIGLWIGGAGTPNKLEVAQTAIENLRAGIEVSEGNPVQLQRCPWCGSPLSAFDVWVDRGRGRLRIQCASRNDASSSCPFVEDLPVLVVDEDLYQRRPALVIATSDKFAALPWRPETGRLFGIGTASMPPELIVQDELHLISGPLGTLAGLYETAVDLLASREGRGPKVIASTATIRRADRQTEALFAREMKQFPPPGLDARDSHFSVEAPSDEKATRMYVGAMAPAVSHTTLMVRSYASLLESTDGLPGDDDVKDPYWTLVGYFNSLRVLGGARMQVQDDVADRIGYLSGDDKDGRRIDQRIELTSRESSSDIPNHLERMKVSRPDDEALDVILATNMISVGVDIDRLGLMVVMGQPQSTSEYIQSTSRVGRRHPGLIVALYNAARSRDRSHYESFRGYHAALYRQVESTSVTPFSARARDRGLHAVLIALARLTAPGFAENSGAATVTSHLDALQILVDQIIARVKRVAPKEEAATRRQLDDVIGIWRRRAEGNEKLVFSQPYNQDVALLADAAKGRIEDENLPTLWSLRDVDLESNLYLVGGGWQA